MSKKVWRTYTAFLMLIISASATVAVEKNEYKTPGGRSLTAFDRIGERNIGGYFDTEYIASDTVNGFKAHRMVLEASSQVHEKILFNTEIEYEYGGNVGNAGEIKLEQAWADFQYSEDHALRTGIVVVPFGVVNVLHDSDYRDSTQRPIYANYIVPSTWMDTGLGGHGAFDVEDWSIQYDAYVLNGFKSGISGTDGTRSARPGFKEDNNRNGAFVTRVAVSPKLGIEAGSSFYTGAYSNDGNDGITMFGLDGTVKEGPFEVIGEWATVSVDGAGVPDKMNGYYLEGKYHFFPEFLKNAFFAEGFDRPVFTAFARYGEVDLDESVTDTNDKSQIILGMNYRPIETAVLKVETEITDSKKGSREYAIISSVAVGF